MIYTISNEDIFQVLSSSFSIGPSETGYELQVGADSRSFTTLFSVGANTPRMVTNVANGSYFRLKNNTGNVKVNWERVCSDDSGGGFDPSVLEPYWTSAQTKDYVDEAVSGISLDGYWTSAQTQSAITAVEDHLFDVEQVTASALTELHEGLLEVSAATSGKADAANITARNSDIPSDGPVYIPKWNEEGIITGDGSTFYRQAFYINGVANAKIYKTQTLEIPPIYAPESAGTAGDILVSTGDGAPVWSAVTFSGGGVSQEYVDSAITGVQDQIDVMDEVVATSLVDLNDRIVELSGSSVDLSAYYTSAQTEDAISAATSGKADAANITGRNTGYYFPYYNEQGVITGDTQVYKQTMTIHLSDSMTGSANLFKDNNYGIPGIYVASKPGTAGQIAKSDGKGFTWANDDKVSSTSVSTIWKGTAAEYDAITTKDPATLYIIL